MKQHSGIEIQHGTITKDGLKIGSAMLELKCGYHPAVLVRVGDKREWFEQDEKNLLGKIVDWVQKNIS